MMRVNNCCAASEVRLEVYPDRLELVEQQRSSDPALLHIALALRAGVQASGTITDASSVAALPLNGRDYLQLSLFSEGAGEGPVRVGTARKQEARALMVAPAGRGASARAGNAHPTTTPC